MPRIIKAPYVNMDAENIYSVATQLAPPPPPPPPVIEIRDNVDLEAIARDIIGEARQEAQSILDSSKKEAENILSQAKNNASAEATKIKEAAKKEGYNEGYKKGEAESKKLIVEAEKTLRTAKENGQKMIEDIEPDTVDVIINICEKIIGNSLSLNPDVIMHLVREGIRRTSKSGYVNIHVCPDDYDTVVENKHDILSYLGGSTQMEIINDFSLSRGDCIIETPLGNVDSSLSLQLKQLLIDLRIMFENR